MIEIQKNRQYINVIQGIINKSFRILGGFFTWQLVK
jgi:hypothetical protein